MVQNKGKVSCTFSRRKKFVVKTFNFKNIMVCYRMCAV